MKKPPVILGCLLLGIGVFEYRACDTWAAQADDRIVRINKAISEYDEAKFGDHRKLSRMGLELEIEDAKSLLENKPFAASSARLDVALRNAEADLR